MPRVAFFTDTFEQINGVALTSRQFVQYAQRHQLPFLCVRGGAATRVSREGSVTHVELKRGPLSFSLDEGLRYDPVLWRLSGVVRSELKRFRPDIIHIVSPGDVSSIGMLLACSMGYPSALSWHTNLHEFGALRLKRKFPGMPNAAIDAVESALLRCCMLYYRPGKVLYAPNQDLVELLRRHTGKPVFLMKRGIDTDLFHPARRTLNDGILRLGYVGRITPEKNVLFLRELERGLQAEGVPAFRFLIVGAGSEKVRLTAELENADFPGIRRGEELALDYANMDVFVFPSRTDTFGNVILEAHASSVPTVVTDAGGPRFIVRDGISGFVTSSDREFIARTALLLKDCALRKRMGAAAREQALGESWDDTFRKVYEGYNTALVSQLPNRIVDCDP